MNPKLPISRQCELIGLPRSSYYYEAEEESEYNLLLMRLIDEQYTKAPFYGTRKMTVWLRWQGYQVNRKRIQRLMRRMGIQSHLPQEEVEQVISRREEISLLMQGFGQDQTASGLGD